MRITKWLILFCLFGMMDLGANAFIVDGIAYQSNDDGTATVINGGKYIGAIIIPSTVTFDETTYIVTKIGDIAFHGCSNLTNVTLPTTIVSIGYDAFNHSGLTSITIPNSVTTIGHYAFGGCSGLTTFSIPSSVTVIAEGLFHSCVNMENVIIPSTVTVIGKGAFSNCPNLNNFEVDSENACFFSENGILYDKYKTTLIRCSEKKHGSFVIPNTVQIISDVAFFGCSQLTSLTISNSVTSIGEGAFIRCSGLKSVIIPNSVTNIGKSAFQGCSSLTSVTLPNAIAMIERYVFEECNSLANVTLFNTRPPMIYSNTFSNPANITFHVPIGYKKEYFASQDIWQSYRIVEDVVYNYIYVNMDDNTFLHILNYDNVNNNAIIIEDGCKSIDVKEDISLKQISYVRNFSNTKWQSLYVPFEIPLTEELLEEFDFAYINGAKLYDWDDDGIAEDLRIEVFKMKSGTLRANMPYLIRAKTTGSKTITVNEATLYATKENSIDCSTTSLKFTFTGGYETLGYDDIGGCYLLGGGTWNEVKEGGTMKPMRFYLRINSRDYQPFKAPVIRMTVFGEDDEVTDIQSPLFQEGAGEAPVFDLQGRRVEHPENGIYIINGKKVIVK